MERPASRFLAGIETANGETIGTGFQVSNHLVVTCAHVVKSDASSDSILVRSVDDGQIRSARLLSFDRDLDLAMLRIDLPLPASVPGLAINGEIPIGVAVAIPGLGETGIQWTGNAVINNIVRGELVTTDVSPRVTPGLSGAPVLLSDGRVFAVVQGVRSAGGESNGERIVVLRSRDIAIPVLEHIVRENQSTGAADSNALTKINDLGRAYRDAGRIADAGAQFEAALLGRRRLLGDRHPDTLTSQHDLAQLYSDEGRLAEATALHENTLRLRTEVLGRDNPDTLTSASNLAFLYRITGRIAEAIRVFADVLDISVQVFGPDHPSTLAAQSNLATAYLVSGRIAEATALLRQTLEARERLLGSDHPATLAAINNLALAQLNAGHPAEAVELFERSLDAVIRVEGTSGPDTLTVRGNLANAYLAIGRTIDAIPLLKRNISDGERILGAEHADAVAARTLLASIEDGGDDR